MKVYLAGPITGVENYKIVFKSWADTFRELGFLVMSPAALPEGFEWEEYMHICKAMIDTCEGVVFLPGWEKSAGARDEHAYAIDTDRRIFELSEVLEYPYTHYCLECNGARFKYPTRALVAQMIARL